MAVELDLAQLAELSAKTFPQQEYCLLDIQLEALCWPSAEWASWVQALGSIAAILLAIWIPWRANQEAGRAQLRRVAAEINLAAVAVSYAAALIKSASEALHDPSEAYAFARKTYRPELFEQAGEGLRDLPLIELDSVDVAESVFIARSSFGLCQILIKELCLDIGVQRYTDQERPRKEKLLEHQKVLWDLAMQLQMTALNRKAAAGRYR